MYKANRKFVEILEQDNKGVFLEAEAILKEGTVVSVGDKVESVLKKGDKVLFHSQHGKSMQHTLQGKKHWFVDEDIVLAIDKK